MNKIKRIIQPINLVLKSRKHLLIVIIASLLMLTFSLLFPVLLTPGNTLGFQISLLNWQSAILIIIFSILFGISIGMNFYVLSLNKAKRAMMLGKEGGTTLFSMTGAIFSTPLCASCIATILGFIGLGSATTLSTTSLLFSYRKEILVVSLILILTSIIFTGIRLGRICDKC